MIDSVPILKVGDVLVVSVRQELDDAIADTFQEGVLAAIEAGATKGLVIDISTLDIVDSYVAQVLVETAKMARLMGTTSVLVGMRPEVAATLTRMGFNLDVETALNVDEGMALLAKRRNERWL